MGRDFLANLGIRYPIVQAPMGGGVSTPQSAAAVCNAGGLGSLGSAYDAPGKIAEEIGQVRSLTGRPLPDFLSLWSGQNGSLGHRMTAAQLVALLAREAGLVD